MSRIYCSMIAASVALWMSATAASAQGTAPCEGADCDTAPCNPSRSSSTVHFTVTEAMYQQLKLVSEDAYQTLAFVSKGQRVAPQIVTGSRSIVAPNTDRIANAYGNKGRIRTQPGRLILEMSFVPILDSPEVPASNPPEPFRVVLSTSAAPTIQALDPTEVWELEQAVAKCTGAPLQ